jgi:hypothetical protein
MYDNIINLQKRGRDMGTVLVKQPTLLLKLSASSLLLSLAVAKLYTYNLNVIPEIIHDCEYIENLKQAYLNNAENDEDFAERFVSISHEVDKLLLECEKENG